MRKIFYCAAILLPLVGQHVYPQELNKMQVDFRYGLPWWQSAICLPDDPNKTLVGKEGQLLLGYDNKSQGIRKFDIYIQPELLQGTTWIDQQTLSARVPIVQTRKEADGIRVLEEAFVVTPRHNGIDPRHDLYGAQRIILVTITNSSAAPRLITPLLEIQTTRELSRSEDGSLRIGNEVYICGSEPLHAENQDVKDVVKIRSRTLPTGESFQVAYAFSKFPSKGIALEQARELRNAAKAWWEQVDLPYDAIHVPDTGIQAMLESSIRNLWQAREIIDGKPAFRVGPTVYRNLFTVDGAFMLETAAMLGRAEDARAGIEYFLKHQEEDGSFAIIKRYYNVDTYWKENGIMLWAALRHAQLTQDKQWLQSQWSDLKRVVGVIQALRKQTMQDPSALNYGLVPGGYIDGGLDNKPPDTYPEYSNVYWSLIGLKAAITAAEWIGEAESARSWQKEYQDFYAAFRNAAKRDMQQDSSGNEYLPIMMNNRGDEPPPKGQWSFCHAVYPGQLFEPDDPLLQGQIQMLRDAKKQGLIFDTGWMSRGIWTYFASFYAHVELWMGNADKAIAALYSFANHATPLRVWREEQKPVGQGTEEVGDMPHNWASAEFIRLAIHLLEIDRGNELHLLEGFPKKWAGPGMVTKLNGVLAPFGELNMVLQISEDGKSAQLNIDKLTGGSCEKIVVHLERWAAPHLQNMVLDPNKVHSITIAL